VAITEENVKDQIVAHWQRQIDGKRYNGLKLREFDFRTSDKDCQQVILKLIENGVTHTPACDNQNKHINRYGFGTVEQQVSSIDFGDDYHTVFYPCKELILERVDLKSVKQKPFSKRLAFGEGQVLPAMFFEVAVLDRYRDDPRYEIRCDDYQGNIVIDSEYYDADNLPERDKISAENFGLGIEGNFERPLVAAFLRYLSNLTTEHQQHRNSFLFLDQGAQMHGNFYKPSILGEFYSANSALNCKRLDLI